VSAKLLAHAGNPGGRGGKVKLEITDKKLRSRMMKEIRSLRYGSEFDLVNEILKSFEARLRDKEQAMLEKLVAKKKVGLGLGMGPGGGPYVYVMLDQITPSFVRDIIRRNEGRSFYDLEPQCGTEAGGLFLHAWKKAIAEGLQQRLFFRHLHRYYTEEALYLQAKAESEARRKTNDLRTDFPANTQWKGPEVGGDCS
jgi:hypothetical protein